MLISHNRVDHIAREFRCARMRACVRACVFMTKVTHKDYNSVGNHVTRNARPIRSLNN